MSVVIVPGSIPMTRGISAVGAFGEFAADLRDRFDVQDLVVPLEETRHAGLVHLHLQSTDPKGAKGRHPVANDPVVLRFNPLDAKRGDGIDVRGSAEPGTA